MSDSFKVYASKDYVENKIEESRVQPDWNQNNPNAADYVKNRTHWVEDGNVILPETVLTWNSDEQGFFGTTPWDTFPEAGKIYTVRYNGVDYDCEGIANENGIVDMGNVSFGGWGGEGGNSDAPFVLSCNPNELAAEFNVYLFFVPIKDGGFVTDGSNMPVTLSISEKETVHTIDPKFLPAGGSGGAFVVTFSKDDTGTRSVDKTFAEIENAITSGQVVLAKTTEFEGSDTWLKLDAHSGEYITFTYYMALPYYITYFAFGISANGTVDVYKQNYLTAEEN